jgi:hypothetical protein
MVKVRSDFHQFLHSTANMVIQYKPYDMGSCPSEPKPTIKLPFVAEIHSQSQMLYNVIKKAVKHSLKD